MRGITLLLIGYHPISTSAAGGVMLWLYLKLECRRSKQIEEINN
jgi:hypothetical protein